MEPSPTSLPFGWTETSLSGKGRRVDMVCVDCAPFYFSGYRVRYMMHGWAWSKILIQRLLTNSVAKSFTNKIAAKKICAFMSQRD